MSRIQSVVLKERGNIPLKVSLIYVIFSALWIVFSDRILLLLIDDVNLMTAVQTVKGWFFILITTLLIFYLLKREIARVRKMEEALIQSEKMLSISRLATGMANQINNPLAGIVQNAQILRKRLTEDGKANTLAADAVGVDLEKVLEYSEKREITRIINSIAASGRIASDLIENMLSFTQEGVREKDVKEPSDLLNSAIDLLKQNIIFDHVKIQKNFDEVPMVRCDPQKLKHALFHILKNAMEAASVEKTDHTVNVSLRAAGKKVEIVVTDKGAGMSSKVLSHIYEPFFSTKSEAKGLGLSISSFIIREIHKGQLIIESSPGAGCRATVTLYP